jgi:hypothetical protein
MKLINNDKLNFIISIFYTYGESLTGGHVALHMLAYKLAERGHNVYIFTKPEYPHKNIHVIPSKREVRDETTFYNSWDSFEYNQNNTISIYNEIMWWNPFNTQHVTRWIMYDTSKEIEDTWSESDVYFNYNNFKTYNKSCEKKLTVMDFHFDKFKITNEGSRKKYCHIFHKNTPENYKDILLKYNSDELSEWKTTGAFTFLGEKFNEYEYFLTFDRDTFLTTAATMCGCKSIILNPDKNINPFEFRNIKPYQRVGVAYGEDDVEWAEKTISFSDLSVKYLSEIQDKTVDDFVDFWIKKTKT